MASAATAPTAAAPAAIANAAFAPPRPIAPPASIGPVTIAACQIDELHATALEKCSEGTTSGKSACPAGPANARPAPSATSAT